jgi:hypothetical protein
MVEVRAAGRRLARLKGSATDLQTASFMPFKSQAQRRKFAQLLVEGKISN